MGRLIFVEAIEMMKSCKYCGRMHEVSVVCPRKPKGVGYDRGGVGAFRRSGAWRSKSLDIRTRDFHTCRVCADGKHGTYMGRQYQTEGLSVHHIVPLAEDFDLRLEDDNLITLCPYHHEQAEAGKLPREYLQHLASSPLFEE